MGGHAVVRAPWLRHPVCRVVLCASRDYIPALVRLLARWPRPSCLEPVPRRSYAARIFRRVPFHRLDDWCRIRITPHRVRPVQIAETTFYLHPCRSEPAQFGTVREPCGDPEPSPSHTVVFRRRSRAGGPGILSSYRGCANVGVAGTPSGGTRCHPSARTSAPSPLG